jgi:hypothetical protein
MVAPQVEDVKVWVRSTSGRGAGAVAARVGEVASRIPANGAWERAGGDC